MNAVFDKIHIDADGKTCPLPPLHDAMQYQHEQKQTNAIDGSKVLPFDRINAEMFYPEQQENKDSTSLEVDMAMTAVAPAILGECCNPKKALSDYVTTMNGQFC